MPHHPFNPNRDPLPQELSADQLEAFESWCEKRSLSTYKRLDGTGYNDLNTVRSFSSWWDGVIFASRQVARETCTWSRNRDDESNIYETTCGNAFYFGEGGLAENEIKFCCYCGKPAEEDLWGDDAAMGAQTGGKNSD